MSPSCYSSVTIESSYQNIGIATSLALTMFNGVDQKNALDVPVFYGMCEALFVGIYCVIVWKMGWTKAPANVSLWTAIMTSYEVLHAEAKELAEIEISVSNSDVTPPENLNREGTILTAYYFLADDPVGPKEPSGELTHDQLKKLEISAEQLQTSGLAGQNKNNDFNGAAEP